MKPFHPIDRMRPSLKHLALAAAMAAVVCFSGGSSAHAASITWNVAADGTWDTGSDNWTGDATRFTNGDTTIFTTGTAGHTITISPDMAPASTTVSGDYTFSGNPLGSGALVKSGGGTLRLNVTPANFSSIQVNGGTLWMLAAGNYEVDGATFNMGTGDVTVEAGATLMGERAYMAGNLIMNGGTYFEDNGFSGSWTGPVTLAADSFFGRDGWAMSQTISGVISGPGGFTFSTRYGAALTLNGTSTYTGKTIVQGGTLQYNVPLSNAGTAGALGAPTGDNAVIDLFPGTTFIYGGPQASTNNGTQHPEVAPYSITDRTINLAGSGSGKVTLNGSNVNDTGFRFDGPFTATGSGPRTLEIRAKGDRPLYIYNGAIPDTSNDQVTVSLVWSSDSSSSDGRIELNGTNTFTGPLNLTGGNNGGPGTARIGGAGVLGNAGAITFSANPASVILNYASSANQTLSGVISGPGDVTVSGTGVLTLSNSNTYSGKTTVTAGSKLELTQSAALGTATSVYLDPSAELKLNFAAPGMVQVARVFVNGVEQAVGLYKAVGGSGAGTELAQITGTGRLLVGVPLVADFTVAPGITGDAPFAVTFTDNSLSILGTVNSWSWNFGDGSTSTTQGPHPVTYPLWGAHTVTLTVGDTTGRFVTTSKTITVTQPLNLVVSSEGQFENAIVNVGPTGTVTFDAGLGGNPDFGGLTGSGTFALKDTANAAVTLEVGSNTLANSTFSGVVTGAGGLTKVGTNTVTLGGQNTYSGDTVVNAGVLELLGTIITPGLAAQFYDADVGEGDGGVLTTVMGNLGNFNSWADGRTPVLNTTTVAYPGDANHYPAHARLWYPDGGNHFYDMGFNSDVLPSVDVDNNYTLRMTGKVKITQAGTYQFGLNSDDGSMLWIDGVSVVNDAHYQGMADNNNPENGGGQATGTIDLSSGYHDIEIAMNEGGGGHGLNVSYQGPDTVADDGSPVGGNPQYPTNGNVNGWVFLPNSVLGLVVPGNNDVLPTATTLRINAGGMLDIAAGTHTVGKLYLNGIGQVAGTWGSSASTATHQDDTYFSGTGVLTVTSAGTANYTSWAAAQSPPLTGGASAVGHDGLPNLVVYAINNLNTNGTNGAPGTLTGKVLSFAKRPDAVTNGDVSYAIETSPNLKNPWTPVTPDVNDGSSISYTLPSGQGKIFARLRVTQN